ncbi:MAG TPA: S26 family signal peptidase [Candidatus Limnocylindria bacterium]|nr:S26 family signal peptidase [Candidatus Limnocylindria bacterium]
MSGRLALAAAVLGGAAAILLALRRAVDVVEVRGGSMAPALLAGDRLLVESVTYRRRPPRPGEVVLAPDPRAPERELIKRIATVDPVAATASLAGDAPDASTDSRAFGPVPLKDVRWRAVGRYWPPRRP